jgi:predicted ATPase/DNA-binding SARP family transcriptional activator
MDAPWRIKMLGWLRATQGDRVVTRFRSQKTGALLAYLAFYRQRSHPREVLIELLWPECGPDAGRHRLRLALSSLRHQLEPPGIPAGAVIVADRASVQLNPAACVTDVAQFEALLQSAAGTGSGTERVQRLTEAVELYRGELLPSCYEEWILPERERLGDALHQALGQLITHLEQAGDLHGALRWARRAVAADSLREEAHRHLIRLLAAVGERDAALRQYHELERLLEGELHTTPEPETDALARELAPLAAGETGRPADETMGRLFPRPPSQRLPASPSPSSLPTGTVTLLLAEIVERTTLRERLGAAFDVVLEGCHELLGPLLRGHGGHVIQASGETLHTAFGRASDALAAAVAGQRALATHPWPEEMGALRVRMALHTGEVEPGDEVHGSPVLAQGTRLLLAAHGGQILLSEETAALLRRDQDSQARNRSEGLGPPGVRLADLGLYRLGGRGHEPSTGAGWGPRTVSAGTEGARWEPGPGRLGREVDSGGGLASGEATPGAERLFEVHDLEQGTQEFPPPNAAPGPVGRLPLSFTRFFGREEEIARLRDLLLSEQTRLVTLTGPGGAGKTRLALEVAASLGGPFQSAIWFVPLVDLADPCLIADKVRDALRLPRSANVQPLEQVVAALSRQSSLLLLDNFEHLLPEGGLTVRMLLERVPTLTCLVTSRRRLDLAGERECPVPPLPTPEGAETPEELIRCASVHLFVDRAQTVHPEFQVTKANAAAVAALCRRLEGIPLALELAAARAQVLTPAQMVAHLEQRFDFLVSRKRDAATRHRSLRAALDWSYQLLSPALRRFFARLSVFRGGWTLAAAEAVCEEPLALEYLEQLRECSMALAESSVMRRAAAVKCSEEHPSADDSQRTTPDGGSEMRFRVLETLREYAWEQLAPEERDLLQRRHTEYYLTLAEQAEPTLRGPHQQFWLSRLEQEHDNLRVALAWSIGAGADPPTCLVPRGSPEAGLRLAGALWRFWDLRGYWNEGRAWLAKALARSSAPERPVGRAKALHAAAWLARRQGDFGTARTLAEEGVALFRGLGDRTNLALALVALGFAFKDPGDYEAALPRFEESVALFRAVDDPWGLAVALDGLAQTLCVMGSVRESRAPFAESLALMRRLGDQSMIARFLTHQGAVVHCQGDYRTARAMVDEILALYREVGDRLGMARTLAALGSLAHAWDDDQTARSHIDESLAILRELGPCHTLAFALDDLARLARDQGDFAMARSLLEEGLAIFRRTGERHRIAEWFVLLGEVARCQGDTAGARARYEESLTIYRELGDTWGMLGALNCLWLLTRHPGDDAAARALYEKCRSLHRELSHKGAIAQSCDDLGAMARHHGDLAAAHQFYRQSLTLQWEADNRGGVATCLEGLAMVAAAQGEPERAARLLGAAAALHETLGTPPRRKEWQEQEALLAALRAALGEAAFTAAWKAGQALTWEQAATEALGKSGGPPVG